MELIELLKLAKEEISQSKMFFPELHVETEKGNTIICMALDVGKIDKIKMMRILGKGFRKENKGKEIKSLTLVSSAKAVDSITGEEKKVVIAIRLQVETGKLISALQKYKYENNDVKWIGEVEINDEDVDANILYVFMQGYDSMN